MYVHFRIPSNTTTECFFWMLKVTKRDYNAPESEWKSWTWRSEGDLMMNGAFFVKSGNPSKNRKFNRRDLIKAKPGTFVTRLTRFSGSLNCMPGLKC